MWFLLVFLDVAGRGVLGSIFFPFLCFCIGGWVWTPIFTSVQPPAKALTALRDPPVHIHQTLIHLIVPPFDQSMRCTKWELTQISASKICCCGCHIHIHTDYRDPVGEKGRRGHSLKRRGPLSTSATPSRGEHMTLALTGFYCFSRPLTSKKVLFYYAKVCVGWLSSQTQERVSLSTSKLGSIPGRSSPDFRKIKILSKHLFASGWGSFSKSKSHSSQDTMQA